MQSFSNQVSGCASSQKPFSSDVNNEKDSPEPLTIGTMPPARISALLSSQTTLQSLKITTSNFRSEHWAQLTGLTKLTAFQTCDIPDSKCLSYLSGLTSLTELNFSKLFTLRSDDLEHLKPLTNLTRLNLGQTVVDGAKLGFLSSLSNLTELEMTGINIYHFDETLASNSKLTKLALAFTTNEDFNGVFFSALQFLLLSQAKHLSDKGMADVAMHTRLQHLHLPDGLTAVSAAGGANLAGLSNLKTLDLSYGRISGKLSGLVSLTHLESLDLSCSDIKDGDLEDWLDKLQNLRVLKLHTTSVSANIVNVLSRMGSLEEISLNRNLTIENIRELFKNLPNIKKFSGWAFSDYKTLKSEFPNIILG